MATSKEGDNMFHLAFIMCLLTILSLSPRTTEIFQTSEEQTRLTSKEIKYSSGISDRKGRSRKEEAEFEALQRKWDALIQKHGNGVNRTQKLLPEEWLLPTIQHNVTFNLTSKRNILTEKVVNFIGNHQLQDRKLYEGLSVSRSSLMDKIRSKAKSMADKLHNNKTNNDENYFNEYPGKNQTIRTHLFEQWNKYYQCLKSNRGFTPKAHYAFSGESVRMTCPACIRPGDGTKIIWTLATLRTRHKPQDVYLSQKRSAFNRNNRISITEKGLNLYIYGVNERDAGNYTCSVSKAILTVHLLQVAEAAENITRVWSERTVGKPHAAPYITLPNFGIKLFTKWKSWTACSRCGKVGKRYRVGVCTIKTTTNSNTNAPAILFLFKEGIPCRSKLLPQSIQDHPNVITRKSEIMEAFCKEPCPKETKYIVKDEKGQVIEEADNSKGVYSMRQKLPQLPPTLKRKILFLKQWDTAHIQCPGSLLSDIPARWFIEQQPIFSKGDRIYVTPSHALVIEDLGLSDSNLYSCWQRNKLVGTVRLVVTQPIRLTFSQQISTISMILIVLTFVLIFCRALCNSLRSKQ